MWKDFKAFAFKGNVIDLAVAVVIGAAFTAIVKAIVDGIIMPVIGAILPSGAWQTWTVWHLQLGLVLSAVVQFLLIALVLFLVVARALRALVEQKIEAPPEPTPSEKLLVEIRDLLRDRR